MRIAVVNNFFPPRPGGSSHLADHLAREYAAAGHEVLVVTASYADAPAREERDGFRIVRVPGWILPKNRFAANFDIAFTISPGTRRRVHRLLDQFEPDVVHQHGQFFDLTWLTGLWARNRRVPTLLSVHTRLESPNRLHHAIYRVADAVLVRPFMAAHRPVVVVMDVHMERYIRRRYRGAFSGTVHIPVGIDVARTAAGDPARARAALGLADDVPIIASVGHVIPLRNRVPLVRALPRILAAHPRTKVVIVGTVYHDECLRLAEELGVRDAILAPGAVPQREVADYLAAAALECHELDGLGFGTASLECLAAGTPVVAAVREDNFVGVHLVDRRHLFLAPFASSTDERADPAGLAEVIVGVLDDPDAARALVAGPSRALVEQHFTIHAVAERHLAELARLAERRTP